MHTLQLGFFFKDTFSNCILRPSQNIILFLRLLPLPVRFFIASIASNDPSTPALPYHDPSELGLYSSPTITNVYSPQWSYTVIPVVGGFKRGVITVEWYEY